MWQILDLHASFLKFSKLYNSGISVNWSIIDEVTINNTTAYIFGQYNSIHTILRLGVLSVFYHQRSGVVNCNSFGGCMYYVIRHFESRDI